MLACEAPKAGKTTTLSALVDFLPDGTVGVFLRGWRAATFDWTDEIGPDRGFLLINEMSDHLPIYVWGPNARAALAPGGSRLRLRRAPCTPIRSTRRSTACAGSSARPIADLAGLTIYLQYSAYRTPSGMYRRVRGGLAPADR